MRKCDHRIQLINETPVCSKPYRYPHVQKEEIERQVQGLLATGFIREIASSYASPLVLVKKKDVFFDDILVYTKTWNDHLEYLTITLQILEENGLAVNFKKCSFGKRKIEYLGHVISVQGVQPDNDKISAIQQWLAPTTMKELRGFLRLSGYYCRFILNYGKIAAPPTALLQKEKEFK
ncbi:uncharacterized protein LOC113859365 [Abrus precatorius]|uniref:Uncharacterized protein LOC113859365 n=1 Tax=Abrus precatorius TaxID=3816 RepID=A0A8B8KVP2_ABRPR|nr:uncharacterized protein LOC113859365 [Abrus precatorius]